MKILFMCSALIVGSMLIGAMLPGDFESQHKYSGFIVSLEDQTMKGLAKAINDLTKEKFVIRKVNYHKKRTYVIVNKGPCKKPSDGKKFAEKYKSIKAMGPNWIVGHHEEKMLFLKKE